MAHAWASAIFPPKIVREPMPHIAPQPHAFPHIPAACDIKMSCTAGAGNEAFKMAGNASARDLPRQGGVQW